MKIPPRGIAKQQLLATLATYRAKDVAWRSGRVFGYVYDAGREAEQACKEAYLEFLGENALDPTVYPSMLRLENEVVAMAAAHLSGDEQVVGNFTSGGTESIMLAVKTARDRARAVQPEIARPQMILPVTAHAAFHKAAHYLGVQAVAVPVDPETFKADVAAMEQAITPQTILLVGSAPSYAHGVVDPIDGLSELGRRRGLLLHVDACIGGFLLPYFARLGEQVPVFDFRLPGVTSISVDLHKYAYAAKGASVLLHRNKQLREHQLFACADWPGYAVINPTVQSSKSGGPLAGAWTVMRFLGDDGYLALARELRDGMRLLLDGIARIEGLRVLGEPQMTLAAVASDTINLFRLAEIMGQRGWYIQPQLGCGPHPATLHLSVSPSNVPHLAALLTDLAAGAEQARGVAPSEVAEMVRQAFAHLDPTSISDEVFTQMTAMAGVQSTRELPASLAEINEILDALPAAVRARLLTKFVNDLFTPPRQDE